MKKFSGFHKMSKLMDKWSCWLRINLDECIAPHARYWCNRRKGIGEEKDSAIWKRSCYMKGAVS
ncbi:hypothetical protein KCP77_18115 [Salmonella enterica subsp. enterica]|nr:hypothetical protein KCP77_18115 [Salmonella enterica subsp. enterica]